MLPPHFTHNRFSSATPPKTAEHGSKLFAVSTTAQISPVRVNFASSDNERLVFPELPAISVSVPLVRTMPADSSRTSSECFCSSFRRDRLFTKLRCAIQSALVLELTLYFICETESKKSELAG